MQALKAPGAERGLSTWHLMQLAPCRAVDSVKPSGAVLGQSYSYLCSCSPLPSSSPCFQVPSLSLLHPHAWTSRVLAKQVTRPKGMRGGYVTGAQNPNFPGPGVWTREELRDH